MFQLFLISLSSGIISGHSEVDENRRCICCAAFSMKIGFTNLEAKITELKLEKRKPQEVYQGALRIEKEKIISHSEYDGVFFTATSGSKPVDYWVECEFWYRVRGNKVELWGEWTRDRFYFETISKLTPENKEKVRASESSKMIEIAAAHIRRLYPEIEEIAAESFQLESGKLKRRK